MGNLLADVDTKAYVADALWHLDRLRSSIHSELTGNADKFLRRQFLAEIDLVDSSLKKVLM